VRGVDIMRKIQNYLSNTDFFKDLITKFEHSDELHITDTNDSISIFAILEVFNKVDHSILLVAPNIFNAQKVFEKLSGVLESNNIGFFPQDEFLTTEMLAMSNEFKLERINTIKKILDNNKMIVVTNTTGLIKYLQPKKQWEKAIIKLNREDIVNVENLISKLVSLGYKREATVEKQGDFSYRGGILDIYPLNEINPVRIEFFDDEVETIRFFDISTQRSTIKTSHIEIFPMFEFHYTSEQFELINEQINHKIKETEFDEKSLARIEDDLFNLESHTDIDKLARYSTFLYKKQETINDYLDNKTIIYWDHKKVKENYETVITDITEWYTSTGDYPKLGFNLVKDINHIYSGKSLYLDVFGIRKKLRNHLEVRAKEPVIYNNNIHMLIKDLNKYKGYTTIIISFSTQKACTFSRI